MILYFSNVTTIDNRLQKQSGFFLLATGRWFSPSTPVSFTNKTNRHDITEILFKVVLNIINQPNLSFIHIILQHIIYWLITQYPIKMATIACSSPYIRLHRNLMQYSKNKGWVSEWVSEWVTFYENTAIFQLYHGKNKLIFNEMMMRSALH
jgi:hypothetical protein